MTVALVCFNIEDKKWITKGKLRYEHVALVKVKRKKQKKWVVWRALSLAHNNQRKSEKERVDI